jgi:hypothetical protein
VLLRGNKKRKGFCCLGVGRSVLDDGAEWATIQNEYEIRKNDGNDYKIVAEQYEMDNRMQLYLMAMNDGQYIVERIDGVGRDDSGLTFDRKNLYTYDEKSRDLFREDDRIIRNVADKRSFEYIARFLEIAWMIPTNTVTNAHHQDTQ